jgi:glycosyltransferase involved in cell wall biosynthesis
MKKKVRKIKFDYIKLSLITEKIFIISLIIIYLVYNKIRLSNGIKNNYCNTNSTLNKGFLKINTNHKGKFTHYDYASNIKIYKDLYKDISYTPITNSNFILQSEQISKEEFSKLCEEGVLLDKTKYKRNNNPKISVIMPYYIISKNLNITMALRSIQNQSLKDVEIILVDDGSLEEKVNYVLNEMKDDNRIILLRHKERKSTLLTRVDGIRYASGEYIIQIDQDDLYLNNLLFENLYNKSKELNVDLIYFNFFWSDNPKAFIPRFPSFPKNVIIKQPKLRNAFLYRIKKYRLSNCKIRDIWNFFTRRTTFMEAIEDLGDEYMNHIYRLYEDTIMMFELSQVAYSFYYYEIEGYRHCIFLSGQSANKNITLENEILAENQLLFIKLLLHKIDPKYDRYHIYKELGFGFCDIHVKYLNKKNFDLGLEVVETVFELERIYKNTAPELMECITKIKKYYET